jgi:hypothetical protein
VDPVFFLQVTRNWTTPFLSHPSLQPLDAPPAPSTSPAVVSHHSTRHDVSNDVGDDSDEELVEIKAQATFDERLTTNTGLL